MSRERTPGRLRRLLWAAVVLGAVVLDVGIARTVHDLRDPQPSAAALSGDVGPFGWQPSRARTRTATTDELVGPVFLSAAGDGTVLRASRGTCGEDGPRVAVQAGGEGDLRPVEVPGLVQVTGLRATDDVLEIAGLDERCRPVGRTSTDAGRSWRAGDVPAVWRLTADADPDTVLSPAGRPIPVIQGCAPLLVQAAPPDSALVSCLSGTLVSVSDAGREPAPLLTAYGLRAAAGDGARTMTGVVGVSCPALVTQVAGSEVAPTGPEAPGEPGRPVCLAQGKAVTGMTFEPGGALLVQAGNSLFRLDRQGAKPRLVAEDR